MAWDNVDRYFSGQGVVLLAPRDSQGRPKGFIPVGNVSDLKLALAVNNLEHKESKSGQRTTDKRLTMETKCNLMMTVENFSKENLASAMRASSTDIPAATKTDEPIYVYPGRVSGLDYLGISSVTVDVDEVAMTAYVDDDTPWDYKLNLDAGSIMFNDGSVQDLAKLGIVPTAITVGGTTAIAMENANLVAGDMVSLRGFTGADAATLNDKTFAVATVTETGITLAVDTTDDTITVAATTYVVYGGMPGTASYTYAAQSQVDALTQGATELFMRFEGLNTAEENEPVVVEVFRFSTDPLKDLSLISDTIQQFVLEGSVYADPFRSTGSKFFRVLQPA